MEEKKNRRYRIVGEEIKTLRQHIKVKEEMKVAQKEIRQLLSHVEKKLMTTIHEKPSKEALDRLAIFAGFQDWESFQDEIEEDKKPNVDEKSSHLPSTPEAPESKDAD